LCRGIRFARVESDRHRDREVIVTAESPNEQEHVTFCRICNAACGIVVTTEGERVLRVRGDRSHPISRGYTCPKGRALAAFHHDSRRLDHPLVRSGDRLRRVDWPEALDDLARQLTKIESESGASAIAYYLGTAIAFDTCGYWASQAFFEALGTPQRYTCATLDTPAKLLVSELMSGFPGLHPIPDVDRCRLLLLIGTNPVVSHGHLSGLTNPVANLRKIARQGEVWVIDPRFTASARAGTRHLAIRPGSDAFLLAYLTRELLEEGADRDYLERHAVGLERLAEAVAPFDLDRTVRATGLEDREILDLLQAIHRHRRLVGLSGTGTTMSADANVAEWLLWVIQILTGSFERSGGAWFNPGFVHRLDRILEWEHGEGLAEKGPASRPELPRRNGEYPCAALVDEIEAGNVRALFVPGGNPITAFPDTERTIAALRSLEVLVVGDVVHNEIVDLATHVWPCTGQLERADLSGVMEFYRLAVIGQRATPVVPPVAERRPVWWCFDQLGERLGRSIRHAGFDGTLQPGAEEELLSIIAGEEVDLEPLETPTVLEEAPVGWVARNLLRGGRWQLAPDVLVDQLRDLSPPPNHVLIPARQLRTMNSALRDVAASGERKDSIEVHLSPVDANQVGADEGDRVCVRSATGELVGTVRIDPQLRSGAVWIPHGWTDPNVGQLTSPEREIDPLTGMVLQSGLAVDVTRWTERPKE
jgi:anaerobic selenocysteine-containing dehydrogenase